MENNVKGPCMSLYSMEKCLTSKPFQERQAMTSVLKSAEMSSTQQYQSQTAPGSFTGISPNKTKQVVSDSTTVEQQMHVGSQQKDDCVCRQTDVL